MDENTERGLVARFQGGDQSAFNALLEAQQQFVLRLALQIMRHEDSALDVAQEVFLHMFKELPHWRGEARFSSWLYRTTLNVCFKHLRSYSQRHKQEHKAAAAALAADDDASNREIMAAINGAVNQLPDRQRMVFILRQYENLQFNEIAAHLDITEGGAKANYHKAIMSLRDKLRNFAPESVHTNEKKEKNVHNVCAKP